MPDFVHAEGLEDRDRLAAFPEFVRDVVLSALESGLVDPGMLPVLQAAWQEIEVAEELPRVRDALLNVDEQTLKEHGLLGSQGEAKRQNILRWYERFREKARGWVLRRFIGANRNLLDSILDALGIGGLLREFLDLLGDCIEEEGERV